MASSSFTSKHVKKKTKGGGSALQSQVTKGNKNTYVLTHGRETFSSHLEKVEP